MEIFRIGKLGDRQRVFHAFGGKKVIDIDNRKQPWSSSIPPRWPKKT